MLRAEWQENSDKPCDTGSDVETMRNEWPMLEWGNLDPVFPNKDGIYAFSRQAVEKRGISARRWLREREEGVVAVVSTKSRVVFEHS